MIIPLEGVNKQLVHEYLVEKFRAELSEKNNHWPAQQKHAKRAATKLDILFTRLHLDRDIHNIEIDAANSCVVVTNKNIKLEFDEK